MLTEVPSTLPPELRGDRYADDRRGIEVHKHLGPGFLESIYQRAMLHRAVTRNELRGERRRCDVLYKG